MSCDVCYVVLLCCRCVVVLLFRSCGDFALRVAMMSCCCVGLMWCLCVFVMLLF